MLTECTPGHDLALRMMRDPRQSIFFVGYTDPDTPGGRLRAAKPGDTFVFSAGAGEVTRQCDVQEFDLTSHANREALLDFAGKASPRVIVLGHGERASRQWFEDQLRARLPGTRVVQPAPGMVVEA
jgi:Cft2 family RNA processing exonuclease